MLDFFFKITVHTIKVCYCCFNCVLGPLCLACHTWRCPCIFEFPKSTFDARFRVFEGRCVNSKKPFRGPRLDRGVAGRNERKQHLSQRGAIDLYSRQINDYFYKKGNREELRKRSNLQLGSICVRTGLPHQGPPPPDPTRTLFRTSTVCRRLGQSRSGQELNFFLL